jgi:ABC-type transport system substrate-binding protein
MEIGAVVNSLDPSVLNTNSGAVAARNEIDTLTQSGKNSEDAAFKLTEWEPGKHATLIANDNAAGGRPFIDSIQIQMGRSARDRLLDLELNKADLAEIPVEQAGGGSWGAH